ncbi:MULTISPECIES: FAD-binding oxidoreductase [unclassified Nitratiruptor]|uniref:NAD(P)/FAD-dependent oxidoreductase n=1 Tax=unclassified Nitratiruptor TaxID=2624044 RepID=UPI0019161E5A|nr:MULTISPECIES: FAD-dependent oxidoreductase [unclassified Nitratiruptor]BCD60541.1 hypothetical protein NitYY0810_C1310 [Nitratiruptor sp. YY08-10]BCD63970.1 hypothetical protein NitYY0814_C0811 [Nitratiruptor sp. YY08-14]
MYDFLIIGAGSAGAHTAYFLKKAGVKVAVVEQSDIAAGGSGAAGAFITPRIGKGGPIQRWTNEAFRFTVKRYEQSRYFYQTGLLRLPKENETFEGLERYLDIEYEKKANGFFFPKAGILKAKPYLEHLLHNIDTFFFEASIEKKGDFFQVGALQAKKVILATGAWDQLIDEPYVTIGKTSGVRFDVRTKLALPYSIHQKVSVSANIDGIVAIGATHQRLESPSKPQPPSFLFDEAKKVVGEFSYEIEQMYCGIRSSVNDHLPIIGELIDTKKVPRITNFKRLDLSQMPRKGIYIINGLGGRGFVFGPFVAKILSDHLIGNCPIPWELDVDRYFIRYLKKGKR